MCALIKKSFGIALAALFFVMVGHLFSGIPFDHVSDNGSDSIGRLSVAVNN
jgi:hypothetical protein